MPIEARTKKAWRRLVDAYGARLTDQYGVTPPQDWCDAIGRCSDRQLNAAIAGVRRASPVYAPSLGQFENCIPAAAEIGRNLIDELAQAGAKLPMCAHQRMRPWSYFGGQEEGEAGRVNLIPKGVVIPECEPCKRKSLRVLVSDLPA